MSGHDGHTVDVGPVTVGAAVTGLPTLTAGRMIRHRDTGVTQALLRRKTGADAHPFPGWWLVGGGGVADRVLEADWELLDEVVGVRYQVGGPLGRAVYDADTFIGLMDTAELAAVVVEALNAPFWRGPAAVPAEGEEPRS